MPGDYKVATSRGEKLDEKRGAWFAILVVLAVTGGALWPPIFFACVGAIAMLFLIR